MVIINALGPSQLTEIPAEETVWGMAWDPYAPQYDLLFEVHDIESVRRRGLVERLNDMDLPVYMQEHYPEIPRSLEYPLATVTDVLGRDYFTSSVAYMVGLAIALGHDISLHGVEMKEEYLTQRANMEWLIGIAEGRGLRVDPGPNLMVPTYAHGNVYPVRYAWR